MRGTPLFIPPISTKLTLAEPWQFTLYQEHRNQGFGEKLLAAGYKFTVPTKYGGAYWYGGEPICKITLPVGAVLTVARIYIRVGLKDFDSVTFNVKFRVFGKKKMVAGRFWARLSEVNTMRLADVVAGTTPAAPEMDEVKGPSVPTSTPMETIELE